MPLKFWNDKNDKKLKEAYFSKYKNIDEYKKFCNENKLPFRYNQLYKGYTPWNIFHHWKKTGKLDLSLWSSREK